MSADSSTPWGIKAHDDAGLSTCSTADTATCVRAKLATGLAHIDATSPRPPPPIKKTKQPHDNRAPPSTRLHAGPKQKRQR